MIKINADEAYALQVFTLRKRLGLNQTEFWKRVGCTQSCGSRYEAGRNVPRAVQSLIKIAYGTSGQAAKELDKLRPGRPLM